MDYSDNLNFKDAFNKVQELNNKLNGFSGTRDSGLAGAMAEIRNNPKQGVNSEFYKKTKAEFDVTQKELVAAQAKLDSIKASIDKDNAKANTKKTVNADIAKAKSELPGLQDAVASLKETNASADEIAVAQAALNEAQARAMGKPRPQIANTPQGVNTKTSGLLTDYEVYPDANGVDHIVAKGTTNEVFIVPPTIPGGVPTPYAKATDAINAMAAAVGGVEPLAKALRAAGYNGTFADNAKAAISAFGVHSLDAFQTSGGKIEIGDTKAFLSSLAKNVSSASGSARSTVSQNLTDRAGSDRYINKFFMDNFGQSANAQAKLDFYNEMHALESSTKTVTTKGVSVGSSLTNADYDVIAAKVSQTYIKNTPVDMLMKNATPGQLASDINKLVSFASDYGVPMTTQQAMQSLAKGLGQSNYLAGQEERIKQLAQTLHPTLAPHIKAGGTVRDVADTYANIKSRKLGITIADSTQDKDVMAAVTHPDGPVNQNKFEMDLQAKPEWWYTPEAHSAVSSFASNILSSFGFGG